MNTPKRPFTNWPRHCGVCNVQWNGGPICWYCGELNFRTGEQEVWNKLSWDEKKKLMRESWSEYEDA